MHLHIASLLVEQQYYFSLASGQLPQPKQGYLEFSWSATRTRHLNAYPCVATNFTYWRNKFASLADLVFSRALFDCFAFSIRSQDRSGFDADYLESEGFKLRCVDDGEELNVALAKRACDVLVLDLNLPNEDGLSIAKRIRNAYPKMGIVILTARVQGIDRTQSYESGADIYLTKPVSPSELKTVILSLSRRIDPVEVQSQWVFQPQSFLLTSPNGQNVKLTPTESAVFQELVLAGGVLPLHILIQRFGEIDTSEELNKIRFEKIISRIRSKLKPFTQEEITIQSVYKQGYQLMLSVKVANSQAHPSNF